MDITLKPLGSAIERIGQATLRWAWLSVLIAISPGLAIFTWHGIDGRDFVATNHLSLAQRESSLQHVLIGAAVIAAVYLGHALWRRRAGLSFEEACVQLNRFAFVVTMSPLLAALLRSNVEQTNALTSLVIIGVCAAVVLVFVYRVSSVSAPARFAFDPTSRLVRLAPWIVLSVLSIGYAWYFARLSLLDHHNYATGVYDLGIYDNVVWRTAHGDFLGCSYCKGGEHASAHFDPILVLLVPFYKLWPRAETLLIFQSVWLAQGVVPLYLIARARLARPVLSLILPAIYVLYPALHGANMFDFHSLTLVAPLLLWAIYLIDARRGPAYFLVLALLLMAREDMSLLACFLGAYAILEKRPILGLATIVLALGYLTTVKLFWMPDSSLLMADKGAISYANFYKDMIPFPEEGVRGLIVSLLTNPTFVLKLLLAQGKLFFFGALLVPLLFLPMISGRKRLTMLYGLIFIGLASRTYVYSLSFQYSVTLFPALLASMADAVARVSQSRVARAFSLAGVPLMTALLCSSLFATALTSAKFGAFATNEAFHAGWTKLERSPSAKSVVKHRKVDDLIATIPKDAAVSSTPFIGPHLSNRKEAYRWPTLHDARYVVIDAENMDASQRPQFEKLAKRELHLVAESGSVRLFERKARADSRRH